jgi:hypothetical protein
VKAHIIAAPILCAQHRTLQRALAAKIHLTSKHRSPQHVCHATQLTCSFRYSSRDCVER